MIHLTTAAEIPGSRARLAVCFGALCYARPVDGGTDEATGLPLTQGTKMQADVTCPACLAVIASLTYRVQVRHRRLTEGEWETELTTTDFAIARDRAQAFRGDGYEARVRQPKVTP